MPDSARSGEAMFTAGSPGRADPPWQQNSDYMAAPQTVNAAQPKDPRHVPLLCEQCREPEAHPLDTPLAAPVPI